MPHHKYEIHPDRLKFLLSEVRQFASSAQIAEILQALADRAEILYGQSV